MRAIIYEHRRSIGCFVLGGLAAGCFAFGAILIVKHKVLAVEHLDLWYILAAIFITFMAYIILLASSVEHVLSFDPQDMEFTSSVKSFHGKRVTKIPLSSIRRITCQEIRVRRTTWWVTVEATADQRVWVLKWNPTLWTHEFTDREEAVRIASAIVDHSGKPIVITDANGKPIDLG